MNVGYGAMRPANQSERIVDVHMHAPFMLLCNLVNKGGMLVRIVLVGAG